MGKNEVRIDIADWFGDSRKRKTSPAGRAAWLDLHISMVNDEGYMIEGSVDSIVRMFSSSTPHEGHAVLQELVTNGLFQIHFQSDRDEEIFWGEPDGTCPAFVRLLSMDLKKVHEQREQWRQEKAAQRCLNSVYENSCEELADNSRTVSPNNNYLEVTEEKKNDITDIETVFRFSENLPTHRKMTREMALAVSSALDLYSAEEIKDAIQNYDFVLGSRDHFWSYRWGLADFCNRGIEKFLTENDPRNNFLEKDRKKAGTEIDPETGEIDNRPKPYKGPER